MFVRSCAGKLVNFITKLEIDHLQTIVDKKFGSAKALLMLAIAVYLHFTTATLSVFDNAWRKLFSVILYYLYR